MKLLNKTGSIKKRFAGIFLAIFSLSFVVTPAIIPSIASALDENLQYQVLAPLPYTTQNCNVDGVSATGQACTTDFVTYMRGAFKLLVALASVLAVIMITASGFQYMTSTSEGGKTAAKNQIYNAIGGLILTLASWLIIYTINPQLTKLDEFKFEKYVGETYSIGTLQSPYLSAAELTEQRGQVSEQLNKEIQDFERQVNAGEIAPEEVEARARELEGRRLTEVAINHITLEGRVNTEDLLKQGADAEQLSQALNQANLVQQKARAAAAEMASRGYTEEADKIILEANAVATEIRDRVKYRKRCPTDSTVIPATSPGAQPTFTPCI